MPVSTVTRPTPAMDATRHWPVPEERRTVSVLFVDIVGSTRLVDRLDPEDVRLLQQEYFGAVAAVLRRWNGTVEKYIGDAVMALFGGVESDGFDAYRAVRAGLEVQRALDGRTIGGSSLVRLRVGVATGEVVVDLAAARDGGHGAVSGAVVTLAARLQEHAPAGAVVVCAATRHATVDLIDYEQLPPATLAGKPTPVVLWRAGGTRPVRATGDEPPFVGRRRELAVLHEQIALAVRDRTPRWVAVVGPDGIGRGRLLTELRHTVRQVDGVPVRWCPAQCPPYPDDPTAPLAALLPDAVDGAASVAYRQALLTLARRQPLVVTVTDVDRAAPEVGRFLHGLFTAATARALPLVVMVTHRPEWSFVPLGPVDRQHRLAVPPLGPVDTGRLLRHLVGDPVRATRLLPLVAGSPGHAVAYAAQTGDDVPGEPPVPDAVRRMVAARLDRFDGLGRAVVMAGAVLGPGFTVEQVADVLHVAVRPLRTVLRELVACGMLVYTRRGYDLADRTLARVAYERLPRRLRAEFHRRAASAGRDEATRTVRLVEVATRLAPAGRVAAVTPSTGRAARNRPVSTGTPAAVTPPLAASA